jgi:hypothetical protein
MFTDNTLIRVFRKDKPPAKGKLIATIGDKDLPHRMHHSPTGFGCGYAGSGPADLALSILDAALPDDGATATIWAKKRVNASAWYLHQAFKFDVVAAWPTEGGQITVGEVRRWAEAKIAELDAQEDVQSVPAAESVSD